MRILHAAPKRTLKRAIKAAARRVLWSYPLHLNEEYYPFFIIGSGRSGSTLLRRILMRNPNIYIPPETYVLRTCIRTFVDYSFIDWNILCRISLSMFAFSQDFDTFPVKELYPLYNRLCNAPMSQRSLAYIIHEFYTFNAQYARPGHRIIWGDKTPMNVYCLDEIDDVFPKSKYIHIIRDGYDVISSMLEMGRYPDVESAATRWIEAITRSQAFGATAGHRYYELKYEDLVKCPSDIVPRICQFLGIEYYEDMIKEPPDKKALRALGDIEVREHYKQVSEPISTKSIGKGREKLSKEQLMRSREIIGRKMIELDYPL